MFALGDVIRFYSAAACKQKYHLCIGLNGHYLLINSPNKVSYPGDFVVPCSDFPFLAPTPEGVSVVCCTLVMNISDAELAKLGLVKKGSVSIDLLKRLIKFVQASPVMSEEDKESILDAVGDWL